MKIKEAYKTAKKEGGLSVVQVLATALTASTVAALSVYISGVVPAVALAGAISIVSALFTEFYKRTLKTAAVTVRLSKNGTIVEDPEETDEGLQEMKKASSKNHQLRLLILLFTAVAFITIGASWYLGGKTEVVHTTTEKTTVIREEVDTQPLESTIGQVELEVSKVAEEQKAVDEQHQAKIGEVENKSAETDKTIEELEGRVAELERQVEELLAQPIVTPEPTPEIDPTQPAN